ncbi:MAG: alpha-L-fucosidase [Oscillospiraceae bacterium]|jgi:alpha-L-fucosidase|nr:alpha-L-fucosidase [Oscillospiraceae bacterium]
MRGKQEQIAYAASIVPSARQISWQQTEFYAFIHFGVNTFTDSEWGSGHEDPNVFNPTKLDCRQWARVLRSAGMRGMVLTAKHHDGFCLWPTKTTAHSVASCRWMQGAGDVVREAADACKAYGLKFGIYLSPWDRNASCYGQGKLYDDFYMTQLRELCENYGDLFCVWFDGACGEGPNGKKQRYDWRRYYDLVRELQPNAAISGRGPDVRWCGNEAGICRSSEWSVVPEWHIGQHQFSELNEQNHKKIPNQLQPSYWDLGSRRAIARAEELIWYPAEVDVSIRDGWFYHEKQDWTVKPLQKLRDIYYASVGANAALLLNIPPTKEGLIHPRDTETLVAFGAQLKIDFKEDLAQDSRVTASCRRDDLHAAPMCLDRNPDRFWHSGDLTDKAELILDLGDDYDINKIVLQEHIATGQQIERFSLWMDQNLNAEGKFKWKRLAGGTVIGYKRVCMFSERRMRRVKLVVEKTRGFATLQSFQAY